MFGVTNSWELLLVVSSGGRYRYQNIDISDTSVTDTGIDTSILTTLTKRYRGLVPRLSPGYELEKLEI